MARDYARIRLDIWTDDDWRDLTPAAQHLYFLLLSSPSLSYCGVADWRPGRLAALASGWSAEDVRQAAKALEDRLFIVTDDETEEVLVRSFIRHDGLMKEPRVAVSMVNAFAAVYSTSIRGVIVHELLRLRRSQPDLRGWLAQGGGPGQALDLLDKRAIDPADLAAVRGSVSSPEEPDLGVGLGVGLGLTPGGFWVTPSPAPSPAPTPAPSPSPPKPSEPETLAPRRKPETPLPDDWRPTDEHHAFAAQRHLDLDHEARQFRSHAEANDRRQRSWNASFTTWLGRAKPDPATKARSQTTRDPWMTR